MRLIGVADGGGAMIKDVDGETGDASESLDQHCNAQEIIRRQGAWRTANVCKTGGVS